MIRVFSPTDTVFTSNGDAILKPLRAIVKKEDNGDYYLEYEFDISDDKFIVKDNQLVADTPQGRQAFRIGNFDKNRRKIKGTAKHVYYDSQRYLIQELSITDKNCNVALDDINSATSNPSPFTVSSDIANLNSMDIKLQSLYEAFSKVIDIWGGHLVRDNFNIQVKAHIGVDNGVTVEYAKNLQDIQATYNWDNVVTKLYPVGKDNIQLEEEYVYSDIQYDLPYTKTVTFEQDIDEKNYPDHNSYAYAVAEDLRVKAQEYVNKHSIPEVNYTLKADLDKVTDVGDVIEVKDSRLGIDLETNVISFEYDCLTKRYTEVEFGTFENKLSSLIQHITASNDEAIRQNNNELELILSNEIERAEETIWGALSSSYCIYEGNQILIVDRLPKESAVNVIRINNGGIAFSQSGINGTFTSAWTIDGTLNMGAINVINLTADLIKGGTLKLGSNINEYGTLKVYDEANTLVATLDKDGLKVNGQDGSYIVMNDTVGFAGYDRLDNLIFYSTFNEFHMVKAVVDNEITLCNKLRFIPINLTDSDNVLHDGIGLVSVLDEDTF